MVRLEVNLPWRSGRPAGVASGDSPPGVSWGRETVSDTDRSKSARPAILLLALVAVAFVGTLAVSGSAAAQIGENGTVDLEDHIYADQTEFDATVTELETDENSTGCLKIEKDGSQVASEDGVEEGDTVTFTEQDVGEIGTDVRFTAILGGSICDQTLDSDSTTVTETGNVQIEGAILADQTEIDVTVTSLRADSEGCVGLMKNGELATDLVTAGDGDTVTFTDSDVGGIEPGDTFNASLSGSSCAEDDILATDSTTVTQRGSVDLDDTLHEGQQSFEVTVTDLRNEDDTGCVQVKNTGDSPVDATDFEEGETRTLTESEVGYLQQGDTVTATLYAQSTCNGSTLATDSTNVGPPPTPTPTPATPIPTDTETPESTPTPTTAGNGTPSTATPTLEPDYGEDARFQVRIDDVRPPEIDGGTLQVDATIENSGEGPGTQTVTLRTGEETLDTRSVTLEDGESQTVTFTAHLSGDTDLRTVEVASENDIEETAATTEDDGVIADGPGFGPGAAILGLAGVWTVLRRGLTGRNRK